MIAKILRELVPPRFRPSAYIERLVYQRTEGRVRSGPFTGMRWIGSPAAGGRIHIPKLLGIYERELGPYIERASGLDFSLIVDVGAAEGYYAVGMALRNSNARIVAFEMQVNERTALAKAAELNGVQDQIEIRGRCEPEELQRVLLDSPRSFIICDVEGYEAVLLDFDAVPSLARAFILVELHEFAERGVTEKIRARFSATHRLTQVWQEQRSGADFPFSDFYIRRLPESYLHWAVAESRPERMSWFWMEPHGVDEAA